MSAAVVMDAESPVQARAERLIARWSELGMQHVALGGACGCGMGGVSLRLDDFELDIADYLEDAGLRSDDSEVRSFFEARRDERAAGDGGAWRPGRQQGPLLRLLEGVRRGNVPRRPSEWLLERLERTLTSFSELHGTPRTE